MARNRKSERGASLVLTTLLLVALLGFAALAVDIGMLYTARTSAQHAADAAALAGAYEFVSPPSPCYAGASSSGCTPAVRSAAIAAAAQNKVMGTTVSLSSANITVDPAALRVTVNVPATGVPLFFARVIPALGSTAAVSTTATAEEAPSATTPETPGGTNTMCLKPVFLPNTALSSAANSATACANGEVIFNPSTGQVTQFAQTQFGLTKNIRPTSPQATTSPIAPGQFYSLNFGPDLCSNNGAKTYQDTIGKCLNQVNNCNPPRAILTCGSTSSINIFDTKNGNMVGPTLKGIEEMLGDTYGPYAYYTGPTSASQYPNHLGVAAVWNNCDPSNPVTSGNASVRTIGFVQIYIDNATKNGNGNNADVGVQAHILKAVDCADVVTGGEGEGGVGGGTGGPAVPIRLVQRP